MRETGGLGERERDGWRTERGGGVARENGKEGRNRKMEKRGEGGKESRER